MAVQPDCFAFVMYGEKSFVSPVPPFGTAPRSATTLTPSLVSVDWPICARPFPYVESSERTNVQFGFRTLAM